MNGLSGKLREIRQDTKTENATGFALVVGRKERVNKWVADNFTFQSGSNSRFDHNSDGYRAGREVSLNAGVSGTNGGGPGLLEG